MAVDLFSLRLNLVTSGLGVAKTELAGVETAAKSAALGATNFANAWEGAKIKFAGTAAEMAAFKSSFSSGFFNEKLIAGMSLAGAEAQKAGQGAAAWSRGLANLKVQQEEAAAAVRNKASAISGLLGPLKSLVGIYASFKIYEFIHDTIEAAASLHELSQKTGASVEMLSMLNFHGKQADVTQEQLAVGFRGLALALGRLRDGQATTVEAFQKIGLAAKDFQGLNTDQAFIKIVEAMKGLPEGLEKSEVATRVFGRSGAELLPLLSDLAEKGFKRAREEAEAGGGIISKEMAEKADRFTDAITRLKASLGGLMREVLMPLLGPLAAFVDGLAAAAAKAKELAQNSGSWASIMFRAGFNATHHADFGDVEGGSSSGAGQRAHQLAEITVQGKTPAELASEAKRAREAHERAMLALLDAKAAGSLDFKGVAASSLALRGGGVGTLTGGSFGSSSDNLDFMGGSLGGDLSTLFAQGGSGKTAAGRFGILQAFREEASRQAVDLKVQFATLGQGLGQTLAGGFANALGAAMRGKNIFAAFGKTVLSGLGNIFSQMGQKLIGYGLIMMKLLPFLSNPFTSGPAALAAGIALTALGAALGGIAHGDGGPGGGSGGGDFRDRVTNITLTAAGAGGMIAPEGKQPIHYHVLGKDSPEGQRIFGEYAGSAKRSRNM